MLQRQAVRLRLNPTEEQRVLLERIAGCCRVLYNIGLDQRRWFARPGRKISYASQAGELAELKQEYPWFAEAPHHCLQQALVDLETAYKNFWSGRAGAPKPRKRGIDDSFRFPDPLQVSLQGNLTVPDKLRTRSLKQASLKLPKLGYVDCVLHRAIAPGTRILSVTVSRDAGNWVASVLLERAIQNPADRSASAVVGIDLGVTQPVVLSTGQQFALPRATAGDLAHQAKLAQRVSSKKKGSKNRRKAISRLAAFKAHQARVRRDAMEKVTTAIAKNHGAVAMEDLRVLNMTASARGTIEEPGCQIAQKSGLNRSILDVSPGALRVRLGQKLAASGGVLLLVPAAHTSQRCCMCGHIESGNRTTRDSFLCLACGHAQDADVNAAVNIRDRAKGLWGDCAKVQVAASLEMLLAQQAKPKRSFKKKKQELATAGLAVSACRATGIRHAQGRKRAAATRPSGAFL
jgi:putative transposase